MPAPILRLYPPPAIEVGTPYEELHLPPPSAAAPSLPYVIINMVSSVDGRIAAAEGGASRIGSVVDRRAMRVLRAKADAVMIGAGTLRAERLSLGLDETSTGPQPIGVVISNSGEVPLESNLISNAGQRILVLVPRGGATPSSETTHHLAAPATSSGAIDLEGALRLLRSEFAVNLLLVEGGPSLNHALVSAELADELLVTLAPKLLDGESDTPATLLSGSALPPTDLRLLHAYLAGDELFLRYALTNRESSPQ